MRTRIRNEKGAALLETAITIPIIMLITVGIFEFGRAYQTWQVLTNAAREGARVAVIAGSTDDQVREVVNNYMTNIGRVSNGANATITIVRNEAVAGWSAGGSRVTISYPFTFMVDFNAVARLVTSGSQAGQPFTMQSVALMRNEG
jgi:Flp pilus assembly protein TadG